MFTDNPNCIELQKNIFLFKNFFSKKDIEDVNLAMNNGKRTSNINYQHPNEWFKEDNQSANIPELFPLWEKISELIYPEFVIHPQLSLLINKPGQQGMHTHTDSPGKSMCRGDNHEACEVSSEDRWMTCCTLEYGAVGYFGDFTGGQLYYPHITKDGLEQDERNDDNCFEVQPEPGDLVIHRAYHPYEHGTREVLSGIKYSFPNFVLTKEDNARTFHNYKTPEYYERIKDLNLWCEPLRKNPLFKDGQRVVPYQKNI